MVEKLKRFLFDFENRKMTFIFLEHDEPSLLRSSKLMDRTLGSCDPLFASEFAPILLCIRVEDGRKGKKRKRKVCSRARDLANGMELGKSVAPETYFRMDYTRTQCPLMALHAHE